MDRLSAWILLTTCTKLTRCVRRHGSTWLLDAHQVSLLVATQHLLSHAALLKQEAVEPIGCIEAYTLEGHTCMPGQACRGMQIRLLLLAMVQWAHASSIRKPAMLYGIKHQHTYPHRVMTHTHWPQPTGFTW